jgi:hypothetical protein
MEADQRTNAVWTVPMLRQFRQIKKDELFCIGCDLSMGCGDWTVAQFFSVTSLDVPMIWDTQESGTSLTNWIHRFLGELHDLTGCKPLVAYELQNGGNFEMDRLAALNRESKFELFTMPIIGEGEEQEKRSDKLGWDTNSATRPEMLANMKSMLEDKIVRIYDKKTVEELFSFIVNQRSNSLKAEAEKNAHDDRVMALAIALKMSQMYPLDRLRSVGYSNQLKKYYQSYDTVKWKK